MGKEDKITVECLTYNVGTIAKLLGISRNSAYKAALKGDIPSIKVGKRILISKARFEKWLNEGGDL